MMGHEGRKWHVFGRMSTFWRLRGRRIVKVYGMSICCPSL
jgi:hypothetical protein